MRATGNNMPDNKTLSIRLTPDGLSFSSSKGNGNRTENNPALPHEAEVIRVIVEIDTPKCMLIPEAGASEGASFLEAAGVELSDRETLVSVTKDSMCLISAADGAAVKRLRDNYGDKLAFTGPLLESVASGKALSSARPCAVLVFRAQSRLYLTLTDDKGCLRFAEVLPYEGEADILYYLARLKTLFPLDKSLICVKGDGAAQYCRILRKYYRHCQCE